MERDGDREEGAKGTNRTRRDKHREDRGESERVGIRGGPSYIDFCPRHPRRATTTPASHPKPEQEAAPAAGVGIERETERDGGMAEGGKRMMLEEGG